MAFRPTIGAGGWVSPAPLTLRLPGQTRLHLPPRTILQTASTCYSGDPYILDGRYSNNAWLQELPKPLTKLTWDNAVHVSPKTAQRLGLENEHLVELASGAIRARPGLGFGWPGR